MAILAQLTCSHSPKSSTSLDRSQFRQATASYDRMNAAAKPLGEELITREQALDQLFAKGEITFERLVAETAAIGGLQGACGRCI